jgi:hypothetical protein
MSDIYLQFKQRINKLIKKDSRYINLSLQDKINTEENIFKLLDDYLQQADFLNGGKKIENMDFIIELLKEPMKEQTAIIDYTNLEFFTKDSLNSLERLLFVFNWAKYFNIKNIIIVSKKNNINKDIKQLVEKNTNIIIINTDGIYNTLKLGLGLGLGKDIFNSMMGNDDSLCLLIIQKLYNSNIPRENIFLLTADTKMLEENYGYIPPFMVSYSTINNGIIKNNNDIFLMDTLNALFYNQSNYNEYLRHLDQHYILEPITISLIKSLQHTYYKKKYLKYKIKYQELLMNNFKN